MAANNAILILIGSLCVVNASIISINIYDGENKSKVNTNLSVKDCSNLDCDQTCRRIGFPSGICVNGRCKCDILRNELKAEPENKVHKVLKPVEGCNYQACDQLCRRLGFPGGACVGDRCQCDNFKQLIEDPKNNDDGISVQIEDCNYIDCDQMCRRMGFPGGACVGDRCDCDNFKPKHKILKIISNCNSFQCDDMCHRLNYAGGICNGDFCECF